MAAELAGDVVKGSAERTIMSRKSHGSARNRSQTSMASQLRVAGANAANVPTPAAAAVVIAAAVTAPARLSSSAADTRTRRSRPSASVPAGCCRDAAAMVASRSWRE